MQVQVSRPKGTCKPKISSQFVVSIRPSTSIRGYSTTERRLIFEVVRWLAIYCLLVVSLLTGRLADFPDRVPQDQQDNDPPKHQAGNPDSKRKNHTGWHHHGHDEEVQRLVVECVQIRRRPDAVRF